MKKKHKIIYISCACLILAALLYMPIFGHLDTLPIRVWDESRLASNAYEMYKNGNYMVPHYQGNPDMWNTKPPLMIWAQVFCMKILGPCELAVRLPSAIAALLTCCFLLFFFAKYLKNFWFGAATVLFLITSEEYVTMHGTRTGDYDSMLALFTTIAYLSLFIYLENEKKHYLYLFFGMLSLAVLTKSIAGLMFLPGATIYIVCRKKMLLFLKNRDFYIGLGMFIFIIGGYYLVREILNPGYLSAIAYNELGGRFLVRSQSDGDGKFFYYFNKLLKHKWIYLIPCGLIMGFLTKNRQINRLTLLSLILFFTYLLIISTSATRYFWYDVPIIPYLSIIAAISIAVICQIIDTAISEQYKILKLILPIALLTICFYAPYKITFSSICKTEETYNWDEDFYRVGRFLQSAVRGNINLDGYTFLRLNPYYDPQNIFYLNILRDNGINIEQANSIDSILRNNVIVFNDETLKYLENNFIYKITYKDLNLIVCDLLETKECEPEQSQQIELSPIN